ncbi:WecB/TagA/CpsF family glycosyltransferase [Sorangium sp. So ce131]|uniref:WecB/TagA/CpsF family glycosyltransferase n=1 Tax=Sorangium sp. So ce131 TaxID=3133282 RepID=UPI003F639792
MVDGVARARKRVRFGQVWVDSVTAEGALDEIERLVDGGEGGSVFTPNVDHVVIAERNPAFREAYAGVSLSLVDGQPLVWASSLVGARLPEKISGSDIIWPLLQRAAARRYRVYFLGGRPGAARAVADRAARELGVVVAGAEEPRISTEPAPEDEAIWARIRAAEAQLLFVALGAPKGELWIHRSSAHIRPAVALSIGAGLDFLAGYVPRAPRWVSRTGFEWLFRLAQEPRRLARRYLIDDPQFAGILYRTCRDARDERVREIDPRAGAPAAAPE